MKTPSTHPITETITEPTSKKLTKSSIQTRAQALLLDRELYISDSMLYVNEDTGSKCIVTQILPHEFTGLLSKRNRRAISSIIREEESLSIDKEGTEYLTKLQTEHDGAVKDKEMGNQRKAEDRWSNIVKIIDGRQTT